MFTILLVFLVVIVWAASKIAHAAQSVIESIGDPHDRVAKLNGAYHQRALEVKQTAAELYVAGKHQVQKRRAS